jgi:hypothetical protein
MPDKTTATYNVDGPVAIATIDRYAERNAGAPLRSGRHGEPAHYELSART